MKKILSFLFALLLTSSLFGCSKPIIYPEETDINQWLKEKTAGYTAVTPSARMVLFKEEEGFKVRIDTASDMIPKLTVENDATNTIAIEENILTVTAETSLYASATHANKVFDPYRNSYTRALQVWQKDETHFRIFFWLYGEPTDFYPIPLLLTEPQYLDMVEIVTAYTEEKKVEALNAGETLVNYTGDFINLYTGQYTSEQAKNPDANLFYQYNGTASEYLSIYRELFAQLNLSEQDWRKSFETLGYTGQQQNLQIVYCDLAVEDDAVSLSLKTKDAYTSPLLQGKNTPLTYAFCPSLANLDYVHLEIK